MSTNYCVNDEFRIFMNITDFPVGKKYYFYQSFRFKDKPLYKLFESYDSTLNFNFKDFDGYLYIDYNKVMRFKKSLKYIIILFYILKVKKLEKYDPEIYQLYLQIWKIMNNIIFNRII